MVTALDARRPIPRRAVLQAFAGLSVAVAAGCRGGGTTPAPESEPAPEPTPPTAEPSSVLPEVEPFTAGAEEVFAAAKTVAARYCESIATFAASATSSDPAAARVGLWRPDTDAVAEVIYPQLGGLAPVSADATTAAVMVVLRQHVASAGATTAASRTRTLDVRLRRVGAQWEVAELVPYPPEAARVRADLPDIAVEVLSNDAIQLPDSSRLDIEAGYVDVRLLQIMSDLAEVCTYAVTVLRTGHPYRVIDGRKNAPVSSHARGRAADIWMIDGESVAEQRSRRDSRGYQVLSQTLVRGGARQIGVPTTWDVDGRARRVFANAVHDDHIHVAV